jgi:2-polyprenyl-3-methyl-5-hydroxy-6-metoxy-1,4-benzoquinol methylase
MTPPSIQARLAALSPEIPWAHYFNFDGVETVSAADGRYFKKSRDAARIGERMVALCAHHLEGGSIRGKRVLDLACGEGGHSLLFARAGADVLGIDGRRLYVDRARFAAEMTGLSANARFELGDMRELSSDRLGTFDLVIASGILHHLAPTAFFPFLKSLAALSADSCFVFTHISTQQ